jgi:hypothetical protein
MPAAFILSNLKPPSARVGLHSTAPQIARRMAAPSSSQQNRVLVPAGPYNDAVVGLHQPPAVSCPAHGWQHDEHLSSGPGLVPADILNMVHSMSTTGST